MEGVLVMKNVSVKLFNFFNGGCIGDQERVCQNFGFINGGSICDQERVCQTLQLHKWRVYWWSRTCFSNSLVPPMEAVLVIKSVSVKLLNFFNGGSIGDQEFVSQSLQLLQWREYWWSRTYLANSSVSSMEGWLVIKNVSVKLYILFNGGSTGYQDVSAKLFSWFNGGSIGDQERVCQTLQFLQWWDDWWSRTFLSNCTSYSMERVLVIKNVSAKLFSWFNGGSIGDQERVCQTLQLHKWRVYCWSGKCLSKFQLH